MLIGLDQVYKTDTKFADKARKKQKANFDTKMRGTVIGPGDRVLVKIVAYDGKHKIADRWESEPYVVLDQPNHNVPVYVVQKETKTGPKRTLHRNLILPVSSLPIPFQGEGETEVTNLEAEDTGEESEPEVTVQITTPILKPDVTVGKGGDVSSEPKHVKEEGEEESEEQEESEEELEEQEESEEEPEEQEESEGEPEEQEESREESEEVREDVDKSSGMEEQGQNTDQAEGESEEKEVVSRKEAPVPLPRRSVRVKKPPSWMTSGEYVMAQVTGGIEGEEEWNLQARSKILKLLASEDVFSKVPKSVALSIWKSIVE